MGIFSSRKVKNEATPVNVPANVPTKWTDFVQWVVLSSESKYGDRNLSGVYQCIELISNTISKLPFFVINTKTKEEVENSKLKFLLNVQPNPNMNAAVFKKTIATNLLTNGNSYVLPRRKEHQLEVERLDVIDPALVSIQKNSETGDVSYNYRTTKNKKKENLRYDEIAHIKVNPAPDGLEGMSPLEYARLTTNIGKKQEEFQESFYTNGGRPDGVLKTTADLSDKEMTFTDKDGKEMKMSYKDALRKAWAEAHSGNKRFNIAVLDNGLEYATIPQISPSDMDFVNSKNSTIEDICRYFNVPPYKLGVGKQTYSNNEQANIEYLVNTIVPLVTQMEQEFTIKFLPMSDIVDKNYAVKCNIEAELRGDSASRAAWYKTMQYVGAYSVNEIRAFENLPKIENGDARLVGANSTPLDLIVKGQTVPKVKSGDKKKEDGANE